MYTKKLRIQYYYQVEKCPYSKSIKQKTEIADPATKYFYIFQVRFFFFNYYYYYLLKTGSFVCATNKGFKFKPVC